MKNRASGPWTLGSKWRKTPCRSTGSIARKKERGNKSAFRHSGEGSGTWTHDSLLKRQVLCQLSYTLIIDKVSGDLRPNAESNGSRLSPLWTTLLTLCFYCITSFEECQEVSQTFFLGLLRSFAFPLHHVCFFLDLVLLLFFVVVVRSSKQLAR